MTDLQRICLIQYCIQIYYIKVAYSKNSAFLDKILFSHNLAFCSLDLLCGCLLVVQFFTQYCVQISFPVFSFMISSWFFSTLISALSRSKDHLFE